MVCDRIGSVFDLIVEEIIKVNRIEDPAACEQLLLKAGLESSSALGQQAGVREIVGKAGESLGEIGLHIRRRIGKTQARSGEKISPPQRLQSQGNPRHTCVAESAAVNEASARNHRQPAQCELLLQVCVLVKALAMRGRRKGWVSEVCALVLDAISESCVCPGALQVIALILKCHVVDVVVVDGAKVVEVSFRAEVVVTV